MGPVYKLCKTKYAECEKRGVADRNLAWLVDSKTGEQIPLSISEGGYMFSVTQGGKNPGSRSWLATPTEERRFKRHPRLDDAIDPADIAALERALPMPWDADHIYGAFSKNRLVGLLNFKRQYPDDVVTTRAWELPGEFKSLGLTSRGSRGATVLNAGAWWKSIDKGAVRDITTKLKGYRGDVPCYYDAQYAVLDGSLTGWNEPKVFQMSNIPLQTVAQLANQKSVDFMRNFR